MELIYILPYFIIIATIIFFSIMLRKKEIIKPRLNGIKARLYKFNNDIELETNVNIRTILQASKELNNTLYTVALNSLLNSENVEKARNNCEEKIKEMKKDIEIIKNELIIQKDTNLQLRKEINILKAG